MIFSTRARLLTALAAPTLCLLLGSLRQGLGQASINASDTTARTPVLPQPARGGTRGPIALVFRPDGSQVYVAEQDENDVAIMDADTGKPVGHIVSGGEQPTAMALTPDNKTLVVANTFSGMIGVLDLGKQTVTARIVLPGEPSGVVVTPDRRVWVSVAQCDQVAVLDLNSAKITQRIPVGHVPRVLALTPDGKTLVCANSIGGSLSLIDVHTGVERARIALPAINLRGIALSPDGSHAYVTGQQPHNDLPTERTETMWSNVLCIVRLNALDKEVGVVERMLTLDLPDYGASDPCGIALDAKGTTAFITLSGTHEVALVPLTSDTNDANTNDANKKAEDTKTTAKSNEKPAVRQTLESGNPDASSAKRNPKLVFKSDGGKVYPHMTVIDQGRQIRRVHVGCNPRTLALRPHSAEVWVGNHLGNSLYALPDLLNNPGDNAPATPLKEPMRIIDLGAATRSPNRRLRGRFFFASAHVTRSQFFSCESCHPNGNTDGLSWKFAHVKDGLQARNTKDLRGMLLLTAPYGWGGREEDFEVFVHDEVGGLLRTRKLEHPEVHALWDLVNETPLPPNPYRNADGNMTEAAERGKSLFTAQGGCDHCHSGDMRGGTKRREWIGTTPEGITLDVPHLVGVYESAPYLHDGRAATLEDIFTKHNSAHLHGKAHTLTKTQLHDLLEYVREL